MRVGLVVEQLRRSVPGGIGSYASGLVQGLAALGPQAPDRVLLASRPPSRPDPLAGLGLPLRTSVLPGALATRAWDVGIRSKVGGLDLVHAVSLALPATGAVPSTACVHDLAWRELPGAYPPRGRRWHEAALARTLRRASRLVVPSEATARALTDAGARAGTVEIVEEGCDHLAPPDLSGTDALLASLGVTGPYLLSVGTLEPRKNLPLLLQAFSLARRRLPGPWPLVVVGPRGWSDAQGRRVPVGSLPGVVLVGAVEPGILSGLYARARCLAYVPLLEGWGLPAVEAMAMGTPVVASPMPSTAGRALEVDPNDAEAVAAGLVRAATDESIRSALAAGGRERAALLTWRAAAKAHLRIWREVAA
ncbi:MAG: glycosyltransferase family 4 protein [Acidimicrobiales bacterium]